jgi:hypothetical protein
MGAQELFDDAQRAEGEGRLDDAVKGYVETVRHAPLQQVPYERLLDIFLHRRKIDEAWCASAMLVAIGKASDTSRDLYEDYRARRLPPRTSGLDDELWEGTRVKDEDLAVSHRAAPFAVDVVMPNDFDRGVLAWAAETIGARVPFTLAEGEPLPARSSLDDVDRGLSLRERLFLAGREAATYRGAHYALGRLAIEEVKKLLGEDDIALWHYAIRLTRNRAGLLACGDPVVAWKRLESESAPFAELAQLAYYAVSNKHTSTRYLLGTFVGAGADADATKRIRI